MRYLRDKYGEDKKTFLALRAVYLAICEVESDFESNPIYAFNKTVGKYAGLSRQVAGKYVRVLEQEGLIQKERIINTDTNLKGKGIYLSIISSQELEKIKAERVGESEEKAERKTSHRVAGFPTIRTSEHSDTPTLVKNISIREKLNVRKKIDKTVNGIKLLKRLKNLEQPPEKTDYLADIILGELGDKHSKAFYRLVCWKVPEQVIRTALSEIKADGATSPPQVFVHRMKEYALSEARKELAESKSGLLRTLCTSSARVRQGDYHPPHTPSSQARAAQSSDDAPSGSAASEQVQFFHSRLSPP
jgi:hypothetical protein